MQSGYDISTDSSSDGVLDAKWLKMFPQCVADKDKSSNFMTRAMFVAFSMILHRRNILGPEFFSTNYITERLKVRSLSFSHDEALAISCKLRSAGEAIKKGYLDELALVISNHEGDKEALEVFSFKMAYFEDGGVAAHFSVTDSDKMTPLQKLGQQPYLGTQTVRDQLIMLARSVHVICQKILKPLPETISANFRISYTSDAPPNYRVEGFFDTFDFYVPHPDIQTATLGHLRPGYHGVLVDCSSVFMEDSFHAETVLKRHVDKQAEELGYSSNSTLYGSFVNDSDSRNTSTGTVESSTVVNVSNGSKNDSLSTEFSEINLKQEANPRHRTPKQQSQKKNVTTRGTPYARGRSRK